MTNIAAYPFDRPTASKRKERLNALSSLDRFFVISLNSVISWKIRKDGVKRNACPKSSKACACRTTCTPCKGLCPVDPAPSARRSEVLS